MSLTENKNPFESVVFQEKVVQAILFDKMWAQQFIEIFSVDELLNYNYLKIVAGNYIKYQRKYKEFPTMPLLLEVIKQEIGSALATDNVLKAQIKDFLQRVMSNTGLEDLPWVKEKATQFCKNRLFKKAIAECVPLSETEEYDKATSIMKKAINAGTQLTSGTNYFDDFEVRYSANARQAVPTGISVLDDKKILNGGLGVGEIGIVVAPSGAGKSQMLVHFGAQALLQGKNVFYYTLELSENLISLRFDSHITDIANLELIDRKEEVRRILKEKRDTCGQLIIKEFASRQTTVNMLRAHMEKKTYEGVRPDLVLVDYAGIVRSSERSDLLRLEMAFVIQELRGIARELNLPIWTALQSNKEGAKSEIVDMTNMSESYGQAAEADFILGLQRNSTQKATGFGNIFIAKNRAGIDGLKYTIHLDTARSKLKVLTAEESEQLEVMGNAVDQRNAVNTSPLRKTLNNSDYSDWKSSIDSKRDKFE